MNPQKQYDYLFDKNTNPTWQAWSLCLVLVWIAFAGWALWVNFQTIWEFGQGFFVLFLLISTLIFSKILHLSSWFVCLGISFGHFVATENLRLKGFKYFGLIFLTNLGQTALLFYLFGKVFLIQPASLPLFGLFCLIPLIGTCWLLWLRQRLHNRLYELQNIENPSDILDTNFTNDPNLK